MKAVPTGTVPTPSPCRAAGVLLFHEACVVLAKRCLQYRGRPVPFPGYWSPFAGAIEEGESPLVAAVRELKEETQLEVELVDLAYITTIDGPARSLVLYAHELPSPFQPVLDEEHTEYGYFKINDLHAGPFPLDGEIRRAISRYETLLRPSLLGTDD